MKKFSNLEQEICKNYDEEQYFKLPNEARGIDQISLLSDKLLLAYLSEGNFYLVDLGQRVDEKMQIALEIRIPGQQIKRFAVDRNMNNLVLVTSGGKTHMYHLPTALTNEKLLC